MVNKQMCENILFIEDLYFEILNDANLELQLKIRCTNKLLFNRKKSLLIIEYLSYTKTKKIMGDIFDDVCCKGYLLLAIDLHTFHPKYEKIDCCTFRFACEFGWLDIAKWIYNKINKDYFSNTIITDTFAYGHIDIVYWLLECSDLQYLISQETIDRLKNVYRIYSDKYNYHDTIESIYATEKNDFRFSTITIEQLLEHSTKIISIMELKIQMITTNGNE